MHVAVVRKENVRYQALPQIPHTISVNSQMENLANTTFYIEQTEAKGRLKNYCIPHIKLDTSFLKKNRIRSFILKKYN